MTAMVTSADIRGFTLVELLITVTVAAVLTALAVPSFQSFVQNYRDTTQANSIVYSLNYARSEAIKRDVTSGVTVCPSADNLTCSGSANWATGWIVSLIDTNGVAQVMQATPALAGANTVTASTNAGVNFRATGSIPVGAAALIVKICDPRGAAFARTVEVNNSGRVASSQTPGKNVAGAALTCP